MLSEPIAHARPIPQFGAPGALAPQVAPRMPRASSYTGYNTRARTAEPLESGSWSLESFHATTNEVLSSATTDGLTWSLFVAVGIMNSSPTGTPVGRRMRP
jgi:hypothetical protein